jgi:hypothetical protein
VRLVIRCGQQIMEIIEQDFTDRGNICQYSRDAIVRAITRGFTVECHPLGQWRDEIGFPEGAD